jgi:hypothetical protein
MMTMKNANTVHRTEWVVIENADRELEIIEYNEDRIEAILNNQGDVLEYFTLKANAEKWLEDEIRDRLAERRADFEYEAAARAWEDAIAEGW